MNLNFPPNLDISPSESSLQHSSSNAFSNESQQKAIQKYGIAGRVWEAAYLLNLYLNDSKLTFDPPFHNRGTIIEIGSGSGLVASCIARSLNPGTELLILTDLPEVCPLLEKNLAPISAELREKAGTDMVLVRPLAWGNPQHAFAIASELLRVRHLTHILCSDLVYSLELLAPLLRTLIQLSSPPFVSPSRNPDLQIIMSYKIRSLSKETPFWAAFGLWFSFEPVLVREDANSKWTRLGSELEGPSFVFVARRRTESFGWSVPDDDSDLLAGKGIVDGSDQAKGDDTFENLLFMVLNGDDDV